MTAQPHDRASQADLVPVIEKPQPQQPADSVASDSSYRTRRRAAAKHARSALFALRSGQAVGPVSPPSSRPPKLFWLPTQRLRRYTGPVLLFAVVLVAVNTLPAAPGAYGRPETGYSGATVPGSDRREQRVAERAPVVFAPAELSSGGLVQRPLAVLGYSDIAAESVAVEEVSSPIAAEPQLHESSAFAALHMVANGETLGAIAEQYHVSATAIAAANAIDPRLLPSGRQLRIPQTQGVPHIVREGETLETIAAQYGVPLDDVRAFAANRLEQDGAISAGDEIFVPGATTPGLPSEDILAAVAAHPVAVVRDDKTNLRGGPATGYQRVGYLGATTPVLLVGQHNGWFKLLTVEGSEGWVAAELLAFEPEITAQLPEITEFPPLPAPAPQPPAEPAPAVDRWVWPAWGEFSSGFGYRNFSVGTFHNGIDIANGRGTPIRAARSGRVLAAGWCGGYGYCVKIDHGDGFVTEYGHMYAAPAVGVGEYVEAGQRIGGMGKTYGRGGYATGVHLHFTIKLSGKAVNPLKYLP